jgi:hypothetical protein
VARQVSRSGGVTGGSRGSSARNVVSAAGGGVGGDCGGAGLTALYLTSRPGPPGFDGFARTIVLRVLLLKELEHVLGAVGGPECQ